jgi:hypothetical protein
MAKQAEQRTVHSILLSVRRRHGSELERTSRIFLQRGTARIVGTGNRRAATRYHPECRAVGGAKDLNQHTLLFDVGHEN